MIRFKVFSLLLFVFLLGGWVGAERVGSLTFTPPPGWAVKLVNIGDAAATLTPPGGPSQGFILLVPDQVISGDANVWFEATVKQLSNDGQVTAQSETATPAGTSILVKSVTIKLAQGSQIRLYTAVFSGKTANLYILVAPNSEALSKLTPSLTALVESAPQAAANAPSGSLLGKKSAIPEVKPMNAAQFMAAGGDPKTQIIPDEFRCYQEKAGNSLTPELVMQVLPGGKYRTPYGAGQISVKKDGSLTKLDWKGGPLDKAYGYLNFGDWGQEISLSNVGEGVLERELSFECYQRGPRENLALLEFKLRTPAAAKYACTPKDGSGKSAGSLEILAGGQYRFGGQTGRYSYDFRGDQDEDWSNLAFTGGGLDDAIGSYSESEAGVREVSIYRPKLSCRQVVKPTPIPRYGTAKAPSAPKGSGGLSGAYVRWYPDPLAALGYGGCGGLCWDVLIFDKSGYVFTDEPEASLNDANCTRTHPNGLPICEVYTLQGGKITVGQDKPETFKKQGATLVIDGETFQPMLKLEGVKLNGAYQSKSFVGGGAGSTVSGGFLSTLNFTPQGKFSRERSGGVSSTFTDNGNSTGNITGGFTSTSQSASSGSYSVKGYTLTLTYGDGHEEQQFVFALPDKSGQPDLELLRIGGSSYTVPDKK